MGRKKGIPGVSFSCKRALGITNAKRKIAKATGIPTTKSGRQRKISKAMTGGCLIPILNILALAIIFALLIF